MKFSHSVRKQIFHFSLFTLPFFFTACADRSRRDEIDDRRDALIERQETELQRAQERLAVVDSLLEQARADHDSRHAWVMAHATQLSDTDEAVLRLNSLRAHRDSLDAEWRMLGAKIQYIHRKQAELDEDNDPDEDEDLDNDPDEDDDLDEDLDEEE